VQIKEKKMARHNDIGKWGEGLAADWLKKKGFSILHTNWRHRRSEIDIIATHEGVYHFVEVKCRNGSDHGYPEEGVSKRKLRTLMKGAVHWLYEQHIHVGKRVQYDVLAIQVLKDASPQYLLIEDVSL
jgi:putative endonuclease